MNLELLAKIKQDVLSIPYEKKLFSEEYAGVYLHSNSPFKLEDHEASFHSFRVFSHYDYPIYLFIDSESYTLDVVKLKEKYDHIHVLFINKLNSVVEFNYFSIYNLPHLIPAEQLIYFQYDGFLIKGGWEERTIGLDWLGAKWKSPVKVIENTLNYSAIRIGNGGCNFRRKSKMLEVLKFVDKHGGQGNIVKGIEIDGRVANQGSFLAEDLFFCYFGFGSKIFNTVPEYEKYVDHFALEPITWEQYNLNPKPCHLFHRIDE